MSALTRARARVAPFTLLALAGGVGVAGLASRVWAPARVGALALVALLVIVAAARERRVLRAAVPFAVALVAAWIAARPPWGPVPSAVIWAGALVLTLPAVLPVAAAPAALAVGGTLALVTGFAAGQEDAHWALVLLVPAGRFVAASVTRAWHPFAGVAWITFAGVPFLTGPWALLAVVTEAAGVWFSSPDPASHATVAWALTGALAVVPVLVL